MCDSVLGAGHLGSDAGAGAPLEDAAWVDGERVRSRENGTAPDLGAGRQFVRDPGGTDNSAAAFSS